MVDTFKELYYQKEHKCGNCCKMIPYEEQRGIWSKDMKEYCKDCWDYENRQPKFQTSLDCFAKLGSDSSYDTVEKPEHYHKNGMDTFTFLEKGFKPEIARGFYIGNIIKYLQRAEDKGGIEDYQKAFRYMKTLLAFEEKREE